MEKEYSQQVETDRLMETCQALTKWERLSGSSQELEAFRYFEKQFQQLGLSTDLVLHDAYISLPVSASLTVDGSDYPCQTHSMSVNARQLSAEICYLESLEELSPKRCMGRIVMAVSRPVYGAVHRAEMAGAAGMICIQKRRICEGIISNAWGSPAPDAGDWFPQIPVVSVTDQIADQILKECTRMQAVMSVETDTGWRKIPSLTATLKAPADTEEYVMFSGHLDSWYYGAIDNGTVNAAQLEVARIASENQADLKRNLKFVMFSGHSHGRYAGSAWYADHHWEELHEHCVLNINADSLGGKGADDLTQSIIMPEAKTVAQEIIRKLTGVEYVGTRPGRLADQSFWICGVTSAFASFSKHKETEPTGSNLGWWWHTPDDTYDKIDPANLKRDVEIFTDYIMRFATADRIPLDFRCTAVSIRKAAQQWKEKAREECCLECVLERIAEVERRLAEFYGQQQDSKDYNRKIMEIGRELVPLYLTTGNIYANDPANPVPALPSLMVIDQMNTVPAGSPDEKQYMVALVRKKNYVMHSLLKVLKIIES